MEKKYILKWQKDTGEYGQSDPSTKKENLDIVAELMNKTFPNYEHWVEAVPDEYTPEKPERTPGLGAFPDPAVLDGTVIRPKGRKGR